MSPDELRLTPLRPIHALALGAMDHSAHNVEEAARPGRYATIRNWVVTACLRPQTTAFLVSRAGSVIGACALTSAGHRAQTVEIRLVRPEASVHTDLVAGVLARLAAIANAQGARQLSIWVTPNHEPAPASMERDVEAAAC